ncbi:hypothetical protein LMG28140_01648 [Paraburkholderia metrosideri]|uniref:Transposase for insertion sequence element IS21-like C-terminal domain-containing protein n=1 Tax=Paraburkholderia metrosideri TaxID=580937 RepID=A0ABN7HKM0_9BURK|nr:hypothetical protein LMG28140_01648 [Paraburkholderia metrosideri]
MRGVVMRRNRRNAAAFQVERTYLMDLPEHRTDFVEDEGCVTRSGTFTVDNSLYSAPSRLIGHRLKVRLYSDRLDCYLSGALVHSTARVRSTSAGRGRAINYRHFIESLKRKPQAFRGLVFRDDLFPREAYHRTWERLDQALSPRNACKAIVGLLELAGNYGVEAELAQRLEVLLELGELPDLEALFAQLLRARPNVPLCLSRCPTPRFTTRCLAKRCSHERTDLRHRQHGTDAQRIASAHNRSSIIRPSSLLLGKRNYTV